MNKTEVVKQFNKVLSDFLNQVSPLIGTGYYTKFNMLTKVNAVFPIKRFGEYGVKHEEQIMSKDPEYFMDESTYTEDIEKYYGDKSQKYMDRILQFKEIYFKVDKDSQENLWTILQVLLLLAKEYIKLNGGVL